MKSLETDDHAGERSRILWIACAGLLLALPAAVLGVPKLADDADIHAVWAAHFSEQLWRGNLYPRWLAGMNAGLGSPAFFFYPPAPYYAAALFRPFLPDGEPGWRLVGLAATLAIVASGLAAYAWLRAVAGPRPALAASILYMAAPYHLAVDLYARGALAELWAFVWMPLVMRGARGLVAARPAALPLTALAFALLVLSHPLAVVAFSAVPCLYALAGPRRRRRLAATAAALALGAGLSAAYWVPTLATRPFVSLQGIDAGRLHYANRFLFTEFPGWSGFDAKIAWLTLNTVVVAGCAAVVRRWGARPRPGQGGSEDTLGLEARFWAAVAAAAFLLTTPLSAPLWRAIPVLAMLQFPFRFNLILALAVTALLAACLASIPAPCPRRTRALLALMGLAVAAWAPAAAWAAIGRYPTSTTDPGRLARIQERLDLAMDVDEYRPRWAMPLRAANLAPFGRSHDLAAFLTGSGRITVRGSRPGDITLDLESREGGLLLVSQFYYPGWRARLVEAGRELPLSPSKPEGLITLAVPAGRDRLHLRLERVRPERIGRAVSAAAAVLSLVLCALAVDAARRSRNNAPMS